MPTLTALSRCRHSPRTSATRSPVTVTTRMRSNIFPGVACHLLASKSGQYRTHSPNLATTARTNSSKGMERPAHHSHSTAAVNTTNAPIRSVRSISPAAARRHHGASSCSPRRSPDPCEVCWASATTHPWLAPSTITLTVQACRRRENEPGPPSPRLARNPASLLPLHADLLEQSTAFDVVHALLGPLPLYMAIHECDVTTPVVAPEVVLRPGYLGAAPDAATAVPF